MRGSFKCQIFVISESIIFVYSDITSSDIITWFGGKYIASC